MKNNVKKIVTKKGRRQVVVGEVQLAAFLKSGWKLEDGGSEQSEEMPSIDWSIADLRAFAEKQAPPIELPSAPNTAKQVIFDMIMERLDAEAV